MAQSPRRRRHSWTRSQSESFGPIRQVGVAISIGLPLLVVGVLLLALLIVSLVETGTLLWVAAGALIAGGLLAAICSRVI